MSARFKVFGYQTATESEGIKELSEVSLCFNGPDEVRNFSDFVRKCANEIEKIPEWDHEHYFSEDADNHCIIISMLDSS